MERNIQRSWQKIAERIKQIRKDQKISQERLSAITGVSTQTISRIEQAREDVQISTILKLLDAFGEGLEISNSYAFKSLIYRLLIKSMRENPDTISEFLHHETYQFLKDISEEIRDRNDSREDYPLILNWEDFIANLRGSQAR